MDKLKQKHLKVNAKKVFFTRDELEYLGFRITRQDIIPFLVEVEALKNIVVLTTNKQ